VHREREPDVDTRTPEELLAIIEEKGREVARAVEELRATLPRS
jgi:hypothetical protein